MTGPSDGGKGDDRRPEAEPDAYARGFEGIDWDARERPTESSTQKVDNGEADG